MNTRSDEALGTLIQRAIASVAHTKAIQGYERYVSSAFEKSLKKQHEQGERRHRNTSAEFFVMNCKNWGCDTVFISRFEALWLGKNLFTAKWFGLRPN